MQDCLATQEKQTKKKKENNYDNIIANYKNKKV